MKECVFHVRPEFLHDLGEGVRGAGDPQPFNVVGHRAGVRIVGVRYCDGDAITHPFRQIELLASAIGAADENARCRVGRPVHHPAAALTDAEVAGILMQQARHDAFRHHVADDLVTEGRAVSPRIAFHPLPKRRVLVFELVEGREGAGYRIYGPIERILKADGQLLAARNRLKRDVAIGSPVVGEHAEDTFVLFFGLWAVGSIRRIWSREHRRSRRRRRPAC